MAGEGPQDPVSRRLNSRVAGEGPQDPVSRRLNSQVAGEGPQDPVSWRFNIVQPLYFLEPQKLTMNRMSQFCKVNSGSTEKVLVRNSSKYPAIIDMDEREDKAVRKEVKVLEVIDKLKVVVKALDTENTDKIEGAVTKVTVDAVMIVTRSDSPHQSKIVVNSNETFSERSKIVFHKSSTEVPKSPQTSKIVFHRSSTESNKKNFYKKVNQTKFNKKNFFKKLDGTVNHEDVPEIVVTHNEVTVNTVHQPTSYPGCLEVILWMPLALAASTIGSLGAAALGFQPGDLETTLALDALPLGLNLRQLLGTTALGSKSGKLETTLALDALPLDLNLGQSLGTAALGYQTGKWETTLWFCARLYAVATDVDTDENEHKDRDEVERPGKDPPSCACLYAVATNVDADENEIKNMVTDIGTDRNQITDVVKTKANDRDYVGAHLTPETLLKHSGREETNGEPRREPRRG